MTLARLSDTILVQPHEIASSREDWEVIGVFNPAVAIVGDDRIMLARVAERPLETRSGWTSLPHWSAGGTAETNWMRDSDLHANDPRVVKLRSSGELRLTSVSHFQLLRQSSADGDVWSMAQKIFPEGPLEEFGIEDPRVSNIDGTYWITYVAVSRAGAATALMSTTDFTVFQRHGVHFPSENKDVVLFPARIAGDYVALHRPNPNSHFSPPQIWIARSPDLVHWGRHEPILSGVHPWEGDRVGAGTPPVLTDEGWLALHHGRAVSASHVGGYAAGVFLLDRDQPHRVLARSPEAIMAPTMEYETNGFVPQVVFPTAMLDIGDQWCVFYGAADTCVAMTRFSKRAVIDSLVFIT